MDFRRLVAARAQGVACLLLEVEAFIEDVEGATAPDEWFLARWQARQAVYECAAIRSALRNGPVVWPSDDLAVAPVDGLAAAECEQVTRLLDVDRELDDAWRADVATFVSDTVAMLELSFDLPMLRSADGLYRSLAIARDLIDLSERLGLPEIVPSAWLDQDAN